MIEPSGIILFTTGFNSFLWHEKSSNDNFFRPCVGIVYDLRIGLFRGKMKGLESAFAFVLLEIKNRDPQIFEVLFHGVGVDVGMDPYDEAMNRQISAAKRQNTAADCFSYDDVGFCFDGAPECDAVA